MATEFTSNSTRENQDRALLREPETQWEPSHPDPVQRLDEQHSESERAVNQIASRIAISRRLRFQASRRGRGQLRPRFRARIESEPASRTAFEGAAAPAFAQGRVPGARFRAPARCRPPTGRNAHARVLLRTPPGMRMPRRQERRPVLPVGAFRPGAPVFTPASRPQARETPPQHRAALRGPETKTAKAEYARSCRRALPSDGGAMRRNEARISPAARALPVLKTGAPGAPCRWLKTRWYIRKSGKEGTP